MKPLYLLLSLGILFSLSAGAQYRCIPSIQEHGNPGHAVDGVNEYGYNYNCTYTGTVTTTVAWQPVAAIGFPFYFNGALVTHFKATNNGILTFDTATTIIPHNSNALLPNANIPDKSICISGTYAANSYTSIQRYGGMNYDLPVPSRQMWISFNCMADSGFQTRHMWAIVLEENTNNIYIVDQNCSAPGNLKLTLGIQVDQATAYMAPGSPNISEISNFYGYSTNNYYYAFTPQTNLVSDGSLIATGLPSFLSNNRGPFEVKAKFRNLGTDTVTSLQLHYSVNGGSTVTQTFSGLIIPTGFSKWFTFTTPFAPSSAGTYNVDMWVDNLNTGNDLDATNNHYTQTVTVEDAMPLRKPMFEEFKGTWCSNSGYWTTKYDSLLNENRRYTTSIHYEDSYSVPWVGGFSEAGQKEYHVYNLGFIPASVVNGVPIAAPDIVPAGNIFQACPWNATQQLIDSLAQLSGLFYVHPYLHIVQDSIAKIEVSIKAATSLLPTQHCRLHIHLVQDSIIYPTYIDNGNSREKMIVNTSRAYFPSVSSGFVHPNSDGDTGVYIGNPAIGHVDSFSYSYTFPVNDTLYQHRPMHVVAFIQDTVTKEIFQSAQSDMPFTGLEPRSNYKAATATRICAGNTVTFENTSVSATSYKWLFSSGQPATSTAATPPAVTFPGPGYFDVTLIATNQYGSDTFTRTQYVYVLDTSTTSVHENFETTHAYGIPNKWWIPSGGPDWQVDSNFSAYGHGTRGLANYFGNYNNSIRESSVIMPTLNFGGISHPTLTYDYSYLKNSYIGSPPIVYYDTLLILVSATCGDSYDTVYKASRDSLITNSVATGNYYPDSTQWKTRVMDLSAYGNQHSVQIMFKYYNNSPNSVAMRLDNINIDHVPQLPVAGFNTTNQQICAGGQINFQNTSTNATSYQWLLPGSATGTSTATSPQVTYDTSGTWPVTLVTGNVDGYDTLQMNAYITVYSKPNVHTSVASFTICQGDTVKLQATGAINYQWSPTTNLSVNNGAATFAYPTAPTIYHVTGTDAHQCSNTDSVSISVNIPQQSVVHDTTKCSDIPLVLDAGTGFNAYAWSTGDTTQTITVNAAGTYLLFTTDVNSCHHKNTVIVQSVVFTGIAGLNDDVYLQVYPNPANDFTVVKVSDNLIGSEMVLRDILGKIVLQQRIENPQFNISVAELAGGMYFLKIESGKQLPVLKLIKQ